MAPSAPLIAPVKRTSTAQASKSNSTPPAASSTSGGTTLIGTLVAQSGVASNTTLQAAPSFRVGQAVSIQLRTYIWIPGTVMGVAFSQQYSSTVYDVQFYAADGSRCCNRFFSRDVRSE